MPEIIIAARSRMATAYKQNNHDFLTEALVQGLKERYQILAHKFDPAKCIPAKQ